jgi:hypothetical protein
MDKLAQWDPRHPQSFLPRAKIWSVVSLLGPSERCQLPSMGQGSILSLGPAARK